MNQAATVERTKSSSGAGGGHGNFRHVARPATLGEFLESLGMSKKRYNQIVRKHILRKAGQPAHKE